GGPSRLRDQQAHSSENFEPTDDRTDGPRKAPLIEPLAPAVCRGAPQLRGADQYEHDGQEDHAHPDRYAAKPAHDVLRATSRRPRAMNTPGIGPSSGQAFNSQVLISPLRASFA